MTVLDASAVLALVNDELGADQVAEALEGAVLPSPNLAEVVGKLVDAGVDASPLLPLLTAAGTRVEPLTASDAVLAGALRALDGGGLLSLGDRCCLAVAVRIDPPQVLTADAAWADLDLPVGVTLIR